MHYIVWAMAKLIDQLKPGMHMREVRQIIPYKPWMIIPENPMTQQEGKTIWIYKKSTASLKIFFQDAIYISHEILPTLNELEKEKNENITSIPKLSEVIPGCLPFQIWVK